MSNQDKPQMGDVIEFVESDWYALKPGERAMVAESNCMFEEDLNRFVAIVPLKGMSADGPYWDGRRMETSGGPFAALDTTAIKLERIGEVDRTYWNWDGGLRRCGGGKRHRMKVTLWRADRFSSGRE